MFSAGDRVLYGIHGVCTVVGMEDRRVDRKNVSYYVLEPLEQPDDRFYVPSANAAAVARMRKLLTAQELNDLLQSEESKRDCWIEDEAERKLRYRDLLNGCDRAAIVSMVRAIRAHRDARAAVGRKLHICDENFLKDSQKQINAEFCAVLGIAPDQVEQYIVSCIER